MKVSDAASLPVAPRPADSDTASFYELYNVFIRLAAYLRLQPRMIGNVKYTEHSFISSTIVA